jgi:TRAP-type C4-dicarboxylate transport system substrate-binding protein
VFSNGTLNNIYSGSQIYNLVLKFNSYDEIDYIRPLIDPLIKQGIHKNGFTVLGLSELGFAYLMSTSPIHNIADLKKQKAWVPENNYTASEAMKAFSITPIPLPLQDVLIALQTNMVDVVAGSPVGALTLQWHTKISYVTDLPIAYVYGGLIISNSAMQKISAEDQLIVKSVMQRATTELDRLTREDNKKAVAAIKNQGIQWIQPDPDTVSQLKLLISTANQTLIKTTHMDPLIVETLERKLSAYRKTRALAH